MRNVLVTGANGQVGSEIRDLEADYPGYNFFFTDSKDLDITDHKEVKRYVANHAITAIINCAAYTAVDKAETEPEKANAINHLAVKNLALISKEKEISLIHISTDYVFDGQARQPYKENDPPNPKSVYGISKLAGEKALQEVNPSNCAIIRTSWVYSLYGANFVKTMLRLGKEKDELRVISDQVGSPTCAQDLARVLLDILPKIKNDQVEIYHYANEGSCSWYDFAKAIFTITQVPVRVVPINSAEFATIAKRPNYSVLNKEKIKEAFQLNIPNWRESLTRCLLKSEPGFIQLPKVLDVRGNLSWFENNNQIPFRIKRIYYINDVAKNEIRGNYALKESCEFIVALWGSFDVVLNDGKNENRYRLHSCDYGLYIPNLFWRRIENFSRNAFALIVSSGKYRITDYIRDFENFKIIRHEAQG